MFVLLVVAVLSGAPVDAGVASGQVMKKVAFLAQGFSTPESVLYDAETDTYLVSNINGDPLAKANKGFISEVSPDGKVLTLRLIAGGEKGVTLNAPKGTGISKGTLYVTDIDTVRLFDRKTGAPRGEVKVPGATFLNDVSVGDDGKVYVTDSGLKADATVEIGLSSTGTDAVYVIEPGRTLVLKTLLKSKALKGPNGILATKDTLYVVSFNSNELTTLDLTGKPKGEVVKLPGGALDGVVMLGGELYISSWEGTGTVFRGKPAGPFTAFATASTSPADLGCDARRARVLVPHFVEGTIEALDTK